MYSSSFPFKTVILGTSIILGAFLLGFFIFKGFKTFSDKDRVVTVKGLAEMEMEAVSSTITLTFTFSGDILPDIVKQTDDKKKAILAYLQSKNIPIADITVKNREVNDRQVYYETQWINNQPTQVKVDRYSLYQSLLIQSKEVKETEDRASQLKFDLVSKGLTSSVETQYTFPELNDIKPQLIAASTKNARIAGEQFANDSKAKLGKIKTASQGQITIAGNYYYGEEYAEKPKEAHIQKARVVSTIVFFLE